MTNLNLIDKLGELALAFPRQEMRPETLALYARHLADLPPAAVCAAIDRAIATCVFPPTIAEIKAAVGELALGDDALPETVWAEVQREIRRVGHNRPPRFQNGRFLPPETPQFADPLVAEAVAATGWAYLCTGEPESVVKAQFERTLRTIRQRAVQRVQQGLPPFGPAVSDGAAALGGGYGDA